VCVPRGQTPDQLERDLAHTTLCGTRAYDGVYAPRPEANNLVGFCPPSRRPIGAVTTFSSEVRMVSIFPTRCPLWLAPVALILAACDGTAPKASQPLSLSVTTKGTSGVSVPAGSA